MRRMLIAPLLLLSAAAAVNRHAPKHPAPPPRPTFDANVVNNVATTDLAGLHDAGSAVLRAQILLDRAHFSVGEIDGTFGENMENTVKAYQASHNIQADGMLDQNTWTALNQDTQPALVPYAINPTDVAGPFYKIPADMMKQAKLPGLGYSSAAEELGERFHINPKILKDLNPGKQLDHAGEQIMVPNITRPPITAQPALVVVKKSCSCLEVFDSQNQLLAHYAATMGSQHDPLPVGDWKIEKPQWNPVFNYNSKLFWDANDKHAKARIKPGPNNPVGVVWIGISKEHYGIHGTPEPSTIGKAQSHGCIRLTNWDATELSNMVKPGMTASLREN